MSEETKNVQEKRVVSRITLSKPLRVVIGSIGSVSRYDLLTKDISTNGFFLDFEKPGRFPFTEASILEVWIELDSSRTIFFNGKIARVVKKEDHSKEGSGIAIKIVQISKNDDALLREFVSSYLEKEVNLSNEKLAATMMSGS